ncbi:MAG TPA: M64 family metallopeptidase, partial [Candidatus Eremiobacteraceae bacterium]|nr:M64 family metallopeptidase [Candidatus Eremiobacteraceae bacterium]
MSTSDGSVVSVTKVGDNGPPDQRWNLVLMGDGYQSGQLDQFHTDASTFCTAFFATKPFDALRTAINVFRVDVSSTDSGADDPTSCGGQNVGSGDVKATYFDSTFCYDGKIRRLLSCKTDTARAVADDKTPHYDQILVIVNSATYGGSGGPVGTTSTGDSNWPTIAIHEMGHSAFGLADEYEYYSGCDSGETNRNTHDSTEPTQPNVTVNKDAATLKWKDLTTTAQIPTS